MRIQNLLGAGLCALFVTAGFAGTAQAQISEVRGGLTEFDERTLNLGGTIKFADETSIGINAEVIFEEPKILKRILTPQPYINGTLNLGGKTSFAGAGLLWRQGLGDKVYVDFAVGGAIHNGTLAVEFEGDPDSINSGNVDSIVADLSRRFDTEIEFGTRLLFREQLTLGVRVTDEWAGEVFFEHLSNAGRFLGNDINDGVNNIGVKVARKF